MYEDDGETMDYQKNVFARTRFTSQLTADKWIFTVAKPEGLYHPETHTYLIKVLLNNKPSTIFEDGKQLSELSALTEVQEKTGWFYDETTRRLWIKTTGGNRNGLTLIAQKI
jgi:hypothetical protein